MNFILALRAEWTRFLRHPVHRRVVAALGLLLLGSALWSGLTAREHRAHATAQQVQWQQARAKAAAAAPLQAAATPAEGAAGAGMAHALGRSDLGATQLPATGGLVLGVQQYAALPTAVRATIESRYTDGRVTGALVNPLLADTGLPGFPAIVVLLLPLAALSLTAGMVQEDREQDIWRLVCVQCSVGLPAVFAAALMIRWAAVLAVAALASTCAFALDPGATVAPLGLWFAALAAFSAFWVLAGGLLSLLPVSSGAAMTGALGLWLSITFVVPAALAWAAERVAPMPSRLAAIVELRTVQQDTEEQESTLFEAWYAAHPQDRPAPGIAPAQPGWPATFLPRFAAQERHLRPIMRSFDTARAVQAAALERWSWASPTLALMLLADRLAGIDAARYVRYIDAVDRFEDRWRAFFVPRVMAYRGATASALAAMPNFSQHEAGQIDAARSQGPALACLWGVGAALALLVVVARRWLERP
jgi:ABC-2 type transport system permease protein